MEVEAHAIHILQRQYDDLRTRLDEAEEILRAISQHEVDAFIVKGSQNEQVFTLQGADMRIASWSRRSTKARQACSAMAQSSIVIKP